MPGSTNSDHDPDFLQFEETSEAVQGTSSSQRQAEQASNFKEKLSQFAYNKELEQKMPSSMNARVLRSANPKVPRPVTGKVIKSVSSRSSSQDPGEDTKDANKSISPVVTTKATKRKADALITTTSKATGPAPKKARIKKSSTASVDTTAPLVNNLKDSVRPGLILISVGVNPGKLTGQLGHPYSHKTNKYWPGLHRSGITPIQHKPSDAPSLMSLYGLGHTNIVPEIATESESGLTTQDFLDGAAKLDAKINTLKPEAVMLLGRGIWYRWMQYKTGKRYDPKKEGPLEMGLKDEEFWVGREVKDGKVVWEGAKTFVLESPSGQAAISNEARMKSWGVVGEWFTPRRERWIKEREKKGEVGEEEEKKKKKKKKKEEASEAEE